MTKGDDLQFGEWGLPAAVGPSGGAAPAQSGSAGVGVGQPVTLEPRGRGLRLDRCRSAGVT